jgi:hypothetical protein
MKQPPDVKTGGRLVCATGVLAACAGLVACSRHDAPAPTESHPAPTPAPSAPAPAAPLALGPNLRIVPQGPTFEVIPGVGFGPIRFGATVETVERLMESPCEIKTDDLCRDLARGADFVLKDGVVVEMRAYRQLRPTLPPGDHFGIFNGRMRNGVQFGMLESGVKELYGAPKKIEPVTEKNPASTVAVHHYDGMRIEYDRIENGNVVVGAFIITKP